MLTFKENKSMTNEQHKLLLQMRIDRKTKELEELQAEIQDLRIKLNSLEI